MSAFYYVYILQSLSDPESFYTGYTTDLENRLEKHNPGSVPHTSKHRPWRIKTAVAGTDKQKAVDFEIYLKTHAGRAFASKRL